MAPKKGQQQKPGTPKASPKIKPPRTASKSAPKPRSAPSMSPAAPKKKLKKTDSEPEKVQWTGRVTQEGMNQIFRSASAAKVNTSGPASNSDTGLTNNATAAEATAAAPPDSDEHITAMSVLETLQGVENVPRTANEDNASIATAAAHTSTTQAMPNEPGTRQASVAAQSDEGTAEHVQEGYLQSFEDQQQAQPTTAQDQARPSTIDKDDPAHMPADSHRADQDMQTHKQDRCHQGQTPEACVAEASIGDATTTDKRKTQLDALSNAQCDRIEKIKQLMSWPNKVLKASWKNQIASDQIGDDDSHLSDDAFKKFLRQVGDTMSTLKISTAFSGIDTPIVALECLSVGLAKEAGVPVVDRPVIQNMYGIENFAKSQLELQRSPNGPKCLFDDMNTFWEPAFVSKMNSLIEQGTFVEVARELLKTTPTQSLISTHSYCVNCDSMCKAPGLY